jgi:hypothetical protein
MIKFGIESRDLDSAALEIGGALGVSFCPHESDFLGGSYGRVDLAHGVIILQRNLDVLDNEPFEQNWPSDQLLLCMDGLRDEAWAPYIDSLRKIRSIEVSEL